MAVFRVEKNKNYTVMSNHHLKDKALSLKSKGLLSMILSLPDEWNYTTRGLASICKEGVDSIGTTLRELETAGYIERNQLRDEKGRISDTEYIIYEFPQIKLDGPEADAPVSGPGTAPPDTASPHTLNPYTENPYMVEPDTDKPIQLNTNINKSPVNQRTESLNIHPSIYHGQAATPQPPVNEPRIDRIDVIEQYRETIRENIEYDNLCVNNPYSVDEIGEIVELMLEAVCTTRKVIRIGGEEMPAELVKSRLLKLDSSHIEYVMDCMNKNTTSVRNIKNYLLTALFNAPATIGNYYKAQVNHDMYGG